MLGQGVALGCLSELQLQVIFDPDIVLNCPDYSCCPGLSSETSPSLGEDPGCLGVVWPLAFLLTSWSR